MLRDEKMRQYADKYSFYKNTPMPDERHDRELYRGIHLAFMLD